jgi:hypothetical protein
MQKAVNELAALGPLPCSANPDLAAIDEFERLIRSIHAPVTDAEAAVLVGLFGADDCFGLAWALLHLIESAPGWPISECLVGDNDWIVVLRERAVKSGKL